WLSFRGYRVFFTERNSSDLVSDTIRRGKKRNLLTPTTFSLQHATDIADRYERHMLPPLQAGYIVVCDRYVYTAFARDVARGCDPAWVRNLYAFAARPD
ncbi:MAG: dTMP kinase, partial [Candidatus Lutacidiplasmatales archaeon]